jgi:hypothetical protein
MVSIEDIIGVIKEYDRARSKAPRAWFTVCESAEIQTRGVVTSAEEKAGVDRHPFYWKYIPA